MRMKNFLGIINLTILVVILLTGGCRSVSKTSSFENRLYPEGRKFTVKTVDESTKKRFEYFLMEAVRHKMIGDHNKSVLYYKEALSVDSTCATCYFELAQLIYQSGDVKNAEGFGFKAVQLDPNNEWFLSFLSKIYHQNNKPELALEAAKFLVKQHPNNIEHLYSLAQFEYSLGNFDKGIDALNKVEKLLGKNEILSLEKHNIFVQKKDFKRAEKELLDLLSAFPGNLNYRVYLGDYYTQRNQLKHAFLQYNKVISGDPGNGNVYFSLANYYLIINDTLKFKESLFKAFGSSGPEFENKFQKLVPFLVNIDEKSNPLNQSDFDKIFNLFLVTHPHESKVFVLYANYLNHKGKVNEALNAYENALLMDEKQEEIWQEFLFLSLNGHSNADFLKHCKYGIKIFPENAILQYLTGVAYSFTGNRNEAIEHLNLVIKFSKGNSKLESQTYGFLGDLYYQEGNSAKSFESYQKALDIDENLLNVLNNFSYYLSVEEVNLEKAEKMISKVIELEPKNATYLDTYAWVLFKRERFFEALFIIEQALNYGGNENGVILEHYGDILYKNGNVEKAVEFWIKAKETNDDDISKNIEKKINEKRYIK